VSLRSKIKTGLTLLLDLAIAVAIGSTVALALVRLGDDVEYKQVTTPLLDPVKKG
jgi:hypothetical protein